jgi:hypothetical protein
MIFLDRIPIPKGLNTTGYWPRMKSGGEKKEKSSPIEQPRKGLNFKKSNAE